MEDPSQLASTIDVSCKRLSIGKTLMYEQIKAGRIRTVRIGSRVLITEQELQRFIAGLGRSLDEAKARESSGAGQ